MLPLCLHAHAESTPEALRKFYFHHFKTEAGLSNGLINDMQRDRRGLLWLGTYNGLNCFDGSHFRSWKADPFNPKALENSVVQGLCEDRQGNIWCATEAGVSRFDRKEFRNYKLIDQVTGEKMTYGTWKVLCTHKGEVYAETMAGLFLYDAKADTFLQFVPRLPDGKLRFEDIYKNTFTLDSLRNGFWMGTDAGIVFFDLEKRRYVDRHAHPGNWDVFNGNNVVPLTMDRKGRLVFSDNTTRELVTWDPTNNSRFAMSTGPWHANREYISTIYVDAQDNKWISTWLPSMYFIEAATGEVRRFAHDPEDEYTVAGNFFWDVHQDDDGTVYLGTINGLSITNLGRSFFSILELPDSISHRTYYFGSLLLGEDHQRKLWFAPSFQYLLRYDLETGRYTKFDVFKGLVKAGPGKRLLVEAMKATEKTIYFGSKVGLFTFDIATETFARMSEIPDSIVNGAWDVKFMEVTRNGELWVACHHVGMLRHDLRTHESRMYRHDPADPHSCAPDLITYLKEDENGELWLNSGKKGPFRYDRKADRFEFLLAQGTVQTGEGISAFARDKSGNFWLLNTV
ncbi:MAG TPA: two-component regulator propeller domain-containing protein, partial [Bacteroidia bacterium]|nr:two-component regulator propeller domain-containing protein [Bacteroidia bacterium]